MPTILAHTDAPCRQCGLGKNLDQAKTAANAKLLLGLLKKQDVSEKMDLSPQYLSDLLRARRPWNSELADRFEAAVAECRA